MTIRLRTVFIIGIILSFLGFLYVERAILTPFIAAGIFAYIFNPIVNFFSHKIKLPRTISVIIIYLTIVSLFIVFVFFLTRGLLYESSEFRLSIEKFLTDTRQEISLLPDYAKPFVIDLLKSVENAEILNGNSFFQYFPKAISGILSLFIFLFASFYFLKEGKTIINKILIFVPNNYKVDVEILLRKINTVLGGYLRGQVFMIFLVSLVLFVALSILGVRFALIIAIFSGIAEIVPIIGPIVAASVAVVAVLFGGGSSTFPLSSIQTSIVIVIVYFLVRQVQDYFILPHVMGRITKLHPLIILFAVLAGGHIGGMLGLLLAVPVAGVLKIILEFSVDTINDRESVVDKKMPGR